MSATYKIHLATEKGGRSVCRYTSRPGRRARFVSRDEFLEFPVDYRCSECSRVLLEPVDDAFERMKEEIMAIRKL